MSTDLKAKDVFSILEVHAKYQRENPKSQVIFKVHSTALEWLSEHYAMLMPEEVVLSLKLTAGPVFAKQAMNYLTSQLN